MHKVGFLGLKGGVGRTMLATQIAARACDNFNMAALVDLDPTAGGTEDCNTTVRHINEMYDMTLMCHTDPLSAQHMSYTAI